MNNITDNISLMMRYGLVLPLAAQSYFHHNILHIRAQSDSIVWQMLCDIYEAYPVNDIAQWFDDFKIKIADYHGTTQIQPYHIKTLNRLFPIIRTLYGENAYRNILQQYNISHHESSLSNYDQVKFIFSHLDSCILEHDDVVSFNCLTAEQQRSLTSNILSSWLNFESGITSLSQNISVFDIEHAHLRFHDIQDVVVSCLENDMVGYTPLWYSVFMSAKTELEQQLLCVTLSHLQALHPQNFHTGVCYRYFYNTDYNFSNVDIYQRLHEIMPNIFDNDKDYLIELWKNYQNVDITHGELSLFH